MSAAQLNAGDRAGDSSGQTEASVRCGQSAARGRYLVPAISELPGLIGYYAGVSPGGSMVHVSVWDSEEHANQMARLKEMIVDARADAQKAGVSFTTPIVNYPVGWVV